MDWLATAFTLAGLWLVAGPGPNTRCLGFTFGMLSNATWIAWAVLVASPTPWSLVVVNFLILGLNARGAMRNAT